MRIEQDDIDLLASLAAVQTVVGGAICANSLRALSVTERRRMIHVLLGEVARVGLKSDDEPNEVGMRLERIIDEFSEGIWDE